MKYALIMSAISLKLSSANFFDNILQEVKVVVQNIAVQVQNKLPHKN